MQLLAHRNRNDFCDLRLRCPSRTPEIAAISQTREISQHCDAHRGPQKSQRFPRQEKSASIAMPIADPRNRSDFPDKRNQPAPKYHTKGCSRSFADSPGARTLVFAALAPFHSCEFRASIARTPFCAILWRSSKKAMLHCDLRVRWKVASDLRFRAAISEPKSPFFLRDFWRFGSVNAEIASDCDCAILVR